MSTQTRTTSAPARYRLGRDVFTTGQIADMLGCSPRMVQKWADGGRLACHRLPGSRDRRFYRADVVRFLDAAGMRRPACLRDRDCLVVTGDEALWSRLAGTAELVMRRACGAMEAAYECGRRQPALVVVDPSSVGHDQAASLAAMLKAREPAPHTVALAHDDADEARMRESGYVAVRAALTFRPADTVEMVEALP